MFYPIFTRTLVPFLLVLIFHIVTIWLLLSAEKPQTHAQAPKVLLVSLAAPAKAKSIRHQAPQETLTTKAITKTELKRNSPAPVIIKHKIETKPKPSVKSSPSPPKRLPQGTEPEPEQKPITETMETITSAKERITPDVISDNMVDTKDETKPFQDQVFTAIQVDARSTQNHPPVYPKLSKRLKEEGTVVLSMLISSTGVIEDISVKESSGYKRLDTAALSAARKWRYEPATNNGKAIAHPYLMPIEFKLNNSRR
jgi:protein TonB